MKKETLLIIATLFVFLVSLSLSARATEAFVASSTNYVLERDSINIGGGLSTSTQYSMESTVGEVGTGRGTSTNYLLEAGYQQIDNIYITITAPADVTLDPNIEITGGAAEGQTSWTVSTNDPSGYSLSIRGSTNPAMTSGGNSFANYTPASSPTPDYTWVVAAADKEFGFTPEGTDIHSAYRDNGSVCAAGSSDTGSACWDSVTLVNKTIATRSTAATAGVGTTVRFRAEAGSSSSPAEGSYTAVVTLTAITL